ncbi:DUF302 domain-containing protein [Ruegeria sp. THAF33]|uniref:DUF302 domain-containing protein n=1 Tax=Ruegeria sp. THAF33 TaxID=2587853 RepID=UPI0012679D5C|nr:DUF302 domain-containing protein [Ruegeria sp. THAF33]QFT72323.1 hypothetical protein FIU92_04725 [Ruegeria sp. THAF33]
MKAFIPLLCLIALPLWAQTAPDGWAVYPTRKPYAELVDATKAAIKENGLIVVTQAGPTKAAAARGISIPGNRVIGAFNNDYAVRVLETSVHAMIEAPIRFYITENKDGTANLSYKTPSFVFAPYVSEGGQNLMDIAAELDSTFQSIAERAVK